jgi:ubiquitin-conjugating enzyme E2 D/E
MSSFMSNQKSQDVSDDEDWVTTDTSQVDMEWIQGIFPDKTTEKVEKWWKVFHDNEFETLNDLKMLDSDAWKSLGLPLAVETRIRNELESSSLNKDALSPTANVSSSRPVSQVDMIVVDISASMRARSTLDVDKTREDVSKMLFHTMIDKLICLELYHGVGLLAFGEEIHPYTITKEYEQFHDFLGRLDANEGATKLYDSIYQAAELIEAYVSNNPLNNENERKKRIFVLTDGEDNRSKTAPWQVAQFLQQKNIQLDAIPVAEYNRTLQSICTASGGICFRADNQEQAVSLFEREATLHIAYREANGKEVKPIVDSESLMALEEIIPSAGVTEIRSAIPPSVSQPVMKKEEISKANVEVRGAGKRILKEYSSFQQDPPDGWNVFINANNINSWKAILKGDALRSPYTNGNWLLTIDFPSDYPFKPPRIKFVTPIYHCNISNDGNICLDILKDSWNPALSVAKALLSISSMLADPNPDDPLDAYKGQLYRDDFQQYIKEAVLHTTQHATQYSDVMSKLLNTND